MLTKDDFKEIRKVVREEVEAEAENTKTEIGSDISMLKIRVVSEMRQMNDRLKNLEIKVNKIQRDLKRTINFFDGEHLALKKRVEKIEGHLNFPRG